MTRPPAGRGLAQVSRQPVTTPRHPRKAFARKVKPGAGFARVLAHAPLRRDPLNEYGTRTHHDGFESRRTDQTPLDHRSGGAAIPFPRAAGQARDHADEADGDAARPVARLLAGRRRSGQGDRRRSRRPSTITPRAATWSPSSPTEPRFSVSATSARWRRSR